MTADLDLSISSVHCANCGSEADASDRFCKSCGARRAEPPALGSPALAPPALYSPARAAWPSPTAPVGAVPEPHRYYVPSPSFPAPTRKWPAWSMMLAVVALVVVVTASVNGLSGSSDQHLTQLEPSIVTVETDVAEADVAETDIAVDPVYDRDYPEENRTAFLDACMSVGGTYSRCICSLEKVEDAYSLNEMRDLEDEMLRSGKVPEPIIDIRNSC